MPASFARAAQLHQAGRLDDAQPLYEALIRGDPGHAEALHMLGCLWFQKGGSDQALALIGQAVALSPSHPGYRYNRALILKHARRFAEAAEAFAAVTALQPADPDAWTGRGETLLAAGRAKEALAAIERALALNPRSPDLLSNQGVALRQLGRAREALAAFDAVIAARPRDAEAHSNRGNALRDLGRPAEALASCDRAMALNPRLPGVHANRGAPLRDLKRLDEALASYDQAAALRPDDADAHYHRGVVLTDLRRPDEALAAYDRVLALRPGDPQAETNKAMVLLLTGDAARGWPLYEARRRLPRARAAESPLWLGETALKDRTILALAEQGLGDTIQFCRYAAVLAGRGARVILQVQSPLLGLLKDLQGPDRLVGHGETPPPHDLHCPLMSVPLALGADAQPPPAARAYLTADPARAQAWAAVLGPRRAPRIGLVWSGRAEHPNDATRSLPLAELLAGLPPGLDYVSLQKEARPADAATLAGRPEIRHFGPRLDDFAETAALVSLMDGVVSVDTSLAHLAGALGKDVRLLLPRIGQDWRWGLSGPTTAWYPSMTLYRQGADCGWAAPLAEASRDLTVAHNPAPSHGVL